MAILKIVSNLQCNLSVDLEYVATLQANVLHRLELGRGVFIVSCTHKNGIDAVSYDYSIEDDDKEYLLRVDLLSVQQKRYKEIFTELPKRLAYHCLKDPVTQLMGVISSDYREIIPFSYDFVSKCYVLEDYFLVSKNDKCGLVHISGREVIPMCYESIDCRYEEKEIFLVEEFTEKWGVFFLSGHHTPCNYKSVKVVSKDRFIVQDQTGLYGVVDSCNNIIVPFLYVNYDRNVDINEQEDYNLIVFQDYRKQYGVITIDNVLIIPFEYKEICLLHIKSRGVTLAKVCNLSNKYGVFNLISGTSIPCIYDQLDIGSEYNKYNEKDIIIRTSSYDGSRRLKLSILGEIILDIPNSNAKLIIDSKYDYAHFCGDNIIYVISNGKRGFIDKNQEVIIPCIYDYISGEVRDYLNGCGDLLYCKDGIWGIIQKNDRPIKVSKSPIGCSRYVIELNSHRTQKIVDENDREIELFRRYDIPWYFCLEDGFGSVFYNGKWETVDINGNIKPSIIDIYRGPYVHIEHKTSSATLESVHLKKSIEKQKNPEGKFVVKDGDDKVIIQGGFEFVWDFKNGLALVVKNGLFGCIDRNQNLVIPCAWDWLEEFDDNGLAKCCKGGKWGFINNIGENIVEAIYDEVKSFRNGIAICRKDGLYGAVDDKGEVRIQFRYYSLDNTCEDDNIIRFYHLYVNESSIGVWQCEALFSPVRRKKAKLWFVEHCLDKFWDRIPCYLSEREDSVSSYFQHNLSHIETFDSSAWCSKVWRIEPWCGKMDINGNIITPATRVLYDDIFNGWDCCLYND